MKLLRPRLAFLSAAFCLAAVASDARAATFTVTTTADSGAGSLRQAILDANASPGPDEIRFAIPDRAPFVISPARELPEITDRVTIDGSTQPGYAGRPLVQLTGPDDNETNGLSISAGGSTIRALVVSRFRSGIYLSTRDGNVVEGCYIGTDWTGSAAAGNSSAGVTLHYTKGNRIGGPSPAQRNVISGNGGYDEGGGGIWFENIAGAVVQGNFIGTDATGTAPVPNSGAGVYRSDNGYPIVVGGLEPGAGNVIAYNGGPAVQGRYARGTTVLSNSFFANGTTKLDYDAQTGISYRVALEADTPVVTFVGQEAAGTRVDGVLRAYPGPSDEPYVVQVFRDPGCEGSGFGQGKERVDTFDAFADENGLVRWSRLVPATLSAGQTVAVTVTRPDATTTRFSRCVDDTRGCRVPYATSNQEFLSAPAGQTVTLAGGVVATGPITYEWFRVGEGGSQRIPGATSDSYTPPAQTAEGDYRAVARNACGEDSYVASIVWCSSAPSIRAQPEGGAALYNSLRDLSVNAGGDRSLAYQWYEGASGDTSRPVAGALYDVFRTPPLTGRTSYWVRVSNACGSVDSAAAVFDVSPPLEITSMKVARGASGAYQIVAKGHDFRPTIRVYVGDVGFVKEPKVKMGKIVQAGELSDGRTIDEAFPRGVPVRVSFFSSERGSLTVEYTRP